MEEMKGIGRKEGNKRAGRKGDKLERKKARKGDGSATRDKIWPC